MSVRVNVRMSKVMSTLIKVGVRTYATYASFLTLPIIDFSLEIDIMRKVYHCFSIK